MAAAHNQPLVAELLLTYGARPGKVNRLDGNFALPTAAERGHSGVVENMLKHRADPEQTHGRTGTRAIDAATKANHAKAVELLRGGGQVLPRLLRSQSSENPAANAKQEDAGKRQIKELDVVSI